MDLKTIDHFIEQSDWMEALNKLNEYGIDPNEDIEVITRLIRINAALKDYSRVEEIIDESSTTNYPHPSDQIRLINLINRFYWISRQLDKMEKLLFEYDQWIGQEMIIKEVPLHKIGEYYQYRGLYFWQTGDLDTAEQSYIDAYQYYEDSDYSEVNNEKGVILMLRGLVERHRGNLEQSIEFYQSALEIFEKCHNIVYCAKVHNNLGNSFRILGEYNKSRSSYLKALQYNEDLNNAHEITLNLNNLGILEHREGNYEKSEEYYARSLQLSLELNNKEIISATYNNLALISQLKGDLSKSLKHYEKALELSLEVRKHHSIANIMTNIIAIQTIQGNFEEAMARYHEFRELAVNYEDSYMMFVPNQALSFIYTEMGEYEKAKQLELINLESMNTLKQPLRVAMTCNNLVVLALALGNIEEAKKYYVSCLELNQDDIQIKQRSQIIDLLIENKVSGYVYSKNRFEKIEKILEMEIYNMSVHYSISFMSIEQLLLRLAENGDPDDLMKIKQRLDNLTTKAREEKLFVELFTAQLLFCKILLLELKINEARSYLDQIIEESNQLGYIRIHEEAMETLNEISAGDSVWLKLQTENTLMAKRIGVMDILKFVQSKGNSFRAFPTF